MPPWSQNSPRLFVFIMRQALESNYVTSNLNHWVDLIYGYKQSGKNAIESINCYHPACYFGYPVSEITDTVHRKAIETMIKTWGQTPKQLFTSAHPQSLANSQAKKTASPSINMASFLIAAATRESIQFPDGSIHRLVQNLKWGSYVGSLEQNASPVCVWRESFKKNIMSLQSLSSNEIIGLSLNKCLLIERAKEIGKFL